MISLLPDGTYQLRQRLCNCGSCLLGRFDKCSMGDLQNEDLRTGIYYQELEEELQALDETDDTLEGDAFFCTEPGKYIALYSATNFEQFYLYLVDKQINGDDTLESKTDVHGHYVEIGDNHFEGFYLEKVRENKESVFYKKIRKRAYVHPDSMFCADVPFNEDTMSINKIDYVRLCERI